MRSPSLRPTACRASTRSIRCRAAIAVFAALTISAPVAALQAASTNVDVKDIRIVGTAKLFFAQPGADSIAENAWVVFQTQPRLREVRQIVVRVRGRRGKSNTTRGGVNCIRSTILGGSVGLKHGAKYRVRFYGRPGRLGKNDTLLTSRTVVARALGSRGKLPPPPNCGT